MGELTQDLIDTLIAPDGETFCRFLRRIYYEELERGRIEPDVPAAEAPVLVQARALELLRPAPATGGLRFTELGYEIGNIAKEYANWLDTGRRLPEGVDADLLRGRRILDVGCSFGRHLLGFTTHGGTVCGVDLQQNYLRLSRVFAAQLGLPPTRIARSRAEDLPFADECFDLVFCRLVLNHVADIDHTLEEFKRVLAPGGTLVFLIEPLGMRVKRVLGSRWRHNWRAIGFTALGLLNTLSLQLGGRQFVVRVKGRMHAQHSPAWPTRRWWSRRLARHGFAPRDGTRFHDREQVGLFRARRA